MTARQRSHYDPDGYAALEGIPRWEYSPVIFRLELEELPDGRVVFGGQWRDTGTYRDWLAGLAAAVERELAAIDSGELVPFDEAGPR